ncbi:DEAD/DEAH box helicase family protein [Sphingomonas aurantiaca]
MTLVLRDYQEMALAALWTYFIEKGGNPLVVLPTGAGKSLTMAEWIKLVFESDPSARIVIVTHVKELVAQNYAELIGVWPEAPAGVYSAGLGRRDLGARIIFASIQSIHSKAFALQQCDLVLIDEAHLIPRNSNTMYQRFLTDLKTINPHLKLIGFTATPFRLDSGLLHEGNDALFTDVAHETSARHLIEEGYLCRPITRPRQTASAQIDTTGVGMRGGEFIAAQLEHAALDPETVAVIADTIVEAGADRKGWLIFCCTVAHCEAMNAALVERGVVSAVVTGDTDQRVRDRTIAEYKAGQIRALCSMGVLTTGFNAKQVDLVALARPTKSTGLYVQMVGRGTRPVYAPGHDLTTTEGRLAALSEGKPNCLVLDFGGNLARHGPFDDPFIKKPTKGDGPAPFKECPECGFATGTSTRICADCGFEFPPPERLVKVEADVKPILTPDPEWIEVSDVAYGVHFKRSDAAAPPTLRVDYRCGLITHSEWVCLSHQGFARSKAEAWWMRRAPLPVPRDVQAAYERVAEIGVPTAIKIRMEGGYARIIAWNFDPIVREDAA